MRNDRPPSYPVSSFTMPPGIAGARASGVAPIHQTNSQADTGFGRFVGTSPAMCALYQKIETAAMRDVPIFLTGEAGTGKGTCAEALHKYSARPAGPFIAFNCQSMPHYLTRAALFDESNGAFARARGGTLFLDDIAEMEPTSQGELLYFMLSERMPASAVRLICATSRPVTSAVDFGLLREDLFNYLYVLAINVPPMRSRGRDVLDLAHLFLGQAAARVNKACCVFTSTAEELLLRHDWPGNIRQLRNLIEQLVTHPDMHPDTGPITAEMLDPFMSRSAANKEHANPLSAATAPPALAALHPAESILFGTGVQIHEFSIVERALLERAIQLCAGNIPKAARRLGLSPSTIYRKKMAWDAQDGPAGR